MINGLMCYCNVYIMGNRLLIKIKIMSLLFKESVVAQGHLE